MTVKFSKHFLFFIFFFVSVNVYADICRSLFAKAESVRLFSGTEGKLSTIYFGVDGKEQPVILKRYKHKGILQREAKISHFIHTTQAKHPALGYIARYEWIVVDGKDYLKLPYYRRSLATFLNDVASGQAQTTKAEMDRLLMQIKQGLGVIHAAGYVHSDVKPDNVLLDDNFNPLIIDFGFTVKVGDQAIGGSDGYMSRNQKAGKDLSPADDFEGGFKVLEAEVGRALNHQEAWRATNPAAETKEL